jgi:hypothetical protein
MSNVRGARRALARGHIDEALVELWNVLEPLRLQGDTAGLEAVGRTAQEIVATGDGSQAREAERLLRQVGEFLGADQDADVDDHVEVVHTPAPDIGLPDAAGYEPAPHAGEPFEADGDGQGEVGPGGEGGRPRRSRIGSLVWALILGGFVLFNIVRGILGE